MENQELQAFLEEQISEQLKTAVLSAPRREELSRTVKIRPVLIRGEVLFQAAFQEGQKELHRNYRRRELMDFLAEALISDYKQLQCTGSSLLGTVLVSKKGRMTIKSRHISGKEPVKIQGQNRIKQYLLPQGEPIPYLVDLGVMTDTGRVIAARYDKYRQINRFLEFVEDILSALPKDREITILDFGCGKSYLTFALYDFLHNRRGLDIRMIGLDLKEDVIRSCQALADKYGYNKLCFYQGDVAEFQGVSQIDMMVTLHACDTATDYALARAVKWGARVILSVPCCQHELNGQIKNDLLEPVLRYGILKERFSAIVTDALRAEFLRTRGYHSQILEFIDMEHTPKNLLIRAVRTEGEYAPRLKAEQSADALMEALHVRPSIARLLEENTDT